MWNMKHLLKYSSYGAKYYYLSHHTDEATLIVMFGLEQEKCILYFLGFLLLNWYLVVKSDRSIREVDKIFENLFIQIRVAYHLSNIFIV